MSGMVDALSLIDLGRARRFLKAEAHDTDDEIARLCEAVTAAFENETDRKLVKRTYTNELYDGPRSGALYGFGYGYGRGYGTRLLLRQWPVAIADVTKVEFSFTNLPSDFEDQDRTNLVVDHDTRTLIFLDRSFPPGHSNVRVTYSAGYSPVPHDLEQAALIQLAHEFRARDRVNVGVSSQTFQGQTTNYFIGQMLPEVSRKLDPYRRVTLGG